MHQRQLSSHSALAPLLLIFIFVAAAYASVAVKGTDCPDVRPVAGLNLSEWTRSTWYIQQQQINGYQQESDLFCVLATYTTNRSVKVPFFKGTVVKVENYENKDEINGKVESTNKNIPSGLCARAPNASLPSSLIVAPCFLPNVLGGPYWIVAFGRDEATGQYTWGAVSGGSPTEKYDDGCTTKETGVNGSGLWIFSRKPVASEDELTEARAALKKLGYTLQRLKPVAQSGCKYAGAHIKE